MSWITLCGGRGVFRCRLANPWPNTAQCGQSCRAPRRLWRWCRVTLPCRSACCLCMKIRPDVYPCGERSPWGADSRLGLLTATHGLVDHEPRKRVSPSRWVLCAAWIGRRRPPPRRRRRSRNWCSRFSRTKTNRAVDDPLTDRSPGMAVDGERPFMECRSSPLILDRVTRAIPLRTIQLPPAHLE